MELKVKCKKCGQMLPHTVGAYNGIVMLVNPCTCSSNGAKTISKQNIGELLEHLSWKKAEMIFTFQKLDRSIRTINGKFIGFNKNGNLLVVENPDEDGDDDDQEIKSIRLQGLMKIEIPFLGVTLKVG
jgi:hypothetical protein